MNVKDFLTSHYYTIGKGEYTGSLTTYARTAGTTKEDIQKIHAIIEDVRKQAGVHGHVFNLKPNRDIELYYYWIAGTFPNLFLPEDDRIEKSEVSFDTIVSYLMFRLAKAGYLYHGDIDVSIGNKFWKLRVKDGEVFRTEGRLCIVYDEDNEYQVGGTEL
jgi:hypothetical protein